MKLIFTTTCLATTMLMVASFSLFAASIYIILMDSSIYDDMELHRIKGLKAVQKLR